MLHDDKKMLVTWLHSLVCVHYERMRHVKMDTNFFKKHQKFGVYIHAWISTSCCTDLISLSPPICSDVTLNWKDLVEQSWQLMLKPLNIQYMKVSEERRHFFWKKFVSFRLIQNSSRLILSFWFSKRTPTSHIWRCKLNFKHNIAHGSKVFSILKFPAENTNNIITFFNYSFHRILKRWQKTQQEIFLRKVLASCSFRNFKSFAQFNAVME